MRSVKEIKLKLRIIQSSKHNAFNRDDDFNYKLYLKIESLLKWVLNKDYNPKKRNKRIRRGKRIKTYEKNMQ